MLNLTVSPTLSISICRSFWTLCGDDGYGWSEEHFGWDSCWEKHRSWNRVGIKHSTGFSQMYLIKMKLKQNTRTDMWPLGARSSQCILDLWDMDQKNVNCWGIVLFRLPPVCATWRSHQRSGLSRWGETIELPRRAESKPVTAEPSQTYVLRIPEIHLRGGGTTVDARPIRGDRNSEMCT